MLLSREDTQQIITTPFLMRIDPQTIFSRCIRNMFSWSQLVLGQLISLGFKLFPNINNSCKLWGWNSICFSGLQWLNIFCMSDISWCLMNTDQPAPTLNLQFTPKDSASEPREFLSVPGTERPVFPSCPSSLGWSRTNELSEEERIEWENGTAVW